MMISYTGADLRFVVKSATYNDKPPESLIYYCINFEPCRGDQTRTDLLRHIVCAPLALSLAMQQHINRLLHGAGTGDRSAVHEEDLVGVLDGVQAMRDDDARGLFR